jgi:hypothetical protein
MLIVPRRKAVASGIWRPSQISTALWVDASDLATITQSSDLASQVNDKSGNGKHLTASGSARPATGTRTINGRNVLDFYTSTNQMLLPSGADAPLAGATSSMAVFVFQLDADPATGTARGAVLSKWGTASGDSDHFPYSDGGIYVGFATTARKTAGNPVPSMSANPCIASLVSAPNLYQVYINGSLLFQTTTNTHSVGTNPTIGGTIDNWFDGRLGEIVVVANNTLTDTRQRLEGYMADPSIWNLRSLYPANHPYKTSSPAPG